MYVSRERDMLSVGDCVAWCVMVYQKCAEKALEPFVLSLHMNLLLLGCTAHTHTYLYSYLRKKYTHDLQ